MKEPRLTRRQVLALGGGLLAAPALGQGQPPKLIRIGVVVPTRTGSLEQPVSSSAHAIGGEIARMGAVMAGEEVGENAELLGTRVKVLLASAPSPEAAARAAQRLVATEGAFALVGGIGPGQAEAIAKVAQERRVLFFNIGNPGDALRRACNRLTFHVEASAAMYLDALTDWFVRANFRRWFLVHTRDAGGQALLARARKALEVRHWGANVAGTAAVAAGQPDFSKELEAVGRARADVVVLLLGGEDQMTFLGQYETSGLRAQVTGFPDPLTQTRDYFYALLRVAPRSAAGYRPLLWEPTLDNYGARELNARFQQRWGQPMDSPGWAAYQSVKMLYESAFFARSLEAGRLVPYLERPQTVFDVHKGIGVSFRPWDHQLRQPFYLVKIKAEPNPGFELSKRVGLASLVGEAPAIVKPGTDPVERLDQLGDGPRDFNCRFGGR